MKRILFIAALLFIFMGCQTTSTTETNGIHHLNEQIETPVIELNDGYIVWDEIEGVTDYEVLMIDYTPNNSCYIMHNEIFRVTNTQFNIENLTDNHQWDIKVRAVVDQGFSLYSESLIVDRFEDLNVTINASMNLQSKDAYMVVPDEIEDVLFITYQVNEQNQVLDVNDFTIKNNRLLILNQALSFIEDTQDFNVYTKEGMDTLRINVVDQAIPSLLSQDYLNYQGQDIVSVFDLAGGIFLSLSGYQISQEDYHFEDGILVVDHLYIDDYFANNLDEDKLVLTYQISLDDSVFTGYIYIKK